MRDISNTLKTKYFAQFSKAFFHIKFTGTLTRLKTKTMLCGDYLVGNLHSKWLFLFPSPCLFPSFWLFHLILAFSYLSKIITNIIQECVCWKQAQEHHHSSTVTAWSINQWLTKRTCQTVIREWVRHPLSCFLVQ